MALIGEARLDSPLLASALAAAPGMTLRLEDVRMPGEADTRFLMWASGDDLPAFEAALEDESTVAEYRVLTDLGGRRLYRFTLSEEGVAASTYSDAAAQDIVVLDLEATVDGIRVLARLPSRDALAAYARACERRGVSFQVRRLYREEAAGGAEPIGQYGVTDAQREALVSALEMGYFDVPRDTSLEAVAEELGVSGQALSTRLRRGQANLVANTLADGT